MVTVDMNWFLVSILMGAWISRDSVEIFKFVVPLIYSFSFIPDIKVPVDLFIILSVTGALGIATFN